MVAQYNRTPHSETGRAPCEFFVKEADINLPTTPYWKPPNKFQPFQIGDLVLRKIPYQPAGERDKLAPRFQGPLKIVEVDPNGVTYRAQWLRAPQKVIQLHISQMKKYHGSVESGSEQTLPEPELARKAPKPIMQPSTGSWLGLHWENLKYIPSMETPEEPVEPQEVLQANSFQSNAGDLNSSNGSVVSEIAPRPGVSPVPVLPDNNDGEIGSWLVSPTASEVISENCTMVQTSTPRRGASRQMPNTPRRLSNPIDPTSGCLGRTRQQTRQLQQQALSVGVPDTSGSGNEQFYSDESTELRGEMGVVRSSLHVQPSIIDISRDNSIIIVNNTREVLNVTIDDPINLSLLKISVNQYRWGENYNYFDHD